MDDFCKNTHYYFPLYIYLCVCAFVDYRYIRPLFQYAIPLSNFSQSAMKIIRDLDPANELRFIRISCTKYDILMATLEFGTVVVMQKPTVTFENKETDDYGMVFPEQHSAPFKSMSF